MLKSRICELLGIEYPVFQGGCLLSLGLFFRQSKGTNTGSCPLIAAYPHEGDRTD